MKVLSIWVSLSLGAVPAQLDVGGAIAVPALVRPLGLEAITIGPIVFYDPSPATTCCNWTSGQAFQGRGPHHADLDELLSHELVHVQQWEALGPAFPVAYALTLGREFEDYWGDEEMWHPPPGTPRCPVIQWSPPRGGLSIFPCWRF